jgi:hypothetical protein
MFVAGPRQLALMEARARGESVTDEELRNVRILSMALSIAGLLLTLAIMVMGVSLSTTEYSFQLT